MAEEGAGGASMVNGITRGQWDHGSPWWVQMVVMLAGEADVCSLSPGQVTCLGPGPHPPEGKDVFS